MQREKMKDNWRARKCPLLPPGCKCRRNAAKFVCPTTTASGRTGLIKLLNGQMIVTPNNSSQKTAFSGSNANLLVVKKIQLLEEETHFRNTVFQFKLSELQKVRISKG